MKSLTLQRIAAVDVFRALTMFLMLFVNDIPGLKNVPHWLMHARMDEDMMGFSDTIFPAFLFCMGMSVSFAIQNRYKKGDNTLQVVAHIFWRTVALIAMGLFSLNSGGIEGGLSHQWFSILMVIGFFLTWGVYPKAEGTKKTLFTAMKTAGVLLLAFGYRSRRSLLVFLLVNLVTQGGFALYLAVTVLNHGVSGWSLLFYIPIEIIITAVELLCYRRLLTEKGRGRAVGYAVAANVCSATVGLLLIDPLWRFIVSIS